MSTTFGILKPAYKDEIKPRYNVNNDLYIEDRGFLDWDEIQEIFEKVFIQFNGEGGRWLSPIANLLLDDTKVWALDNSPQGIYTIGDIKNTIKI